MVWWVKWNVQFDRVDIKIEIGGKKMCGLLGNLKNWLGLSVNLAMTNAYYDYFIFEQRNI